MNYVTTLKAFEEAVLAHNVRDLALFKAANVRLDAQIADIGEERFASDLNAYNTLQAASHLACGSLLQTKLFGSKLHISLSLSLFLSLSASPTY
jgi:hypothetical protein